MFLILFGFDLSVALCCGDKVLYNYVTTSSLCPPQMHHIHPGTINLECMNSFNNLYLHNFRRMLKETCQMHALVSTSLLCVKLNDKITPVSRLQHAVVSTCNCMLPFNMQSVFNNDCNGVKCLIVLPCTDVCLC